MKQQILVDMDGVLADVYTQFITMEYNESGLKLKTEELNGIREEEAFPSFERHVRSKGFFRTAPLMPGSVEGLNYLNDTYEVLIVSSATEFPDSLAEKQQWLNEHFPFITWQQMIFCGSKKNIRGDVMIDDHPKNLYTFDGERILFNQPHNYNVKEESFRRVFSWKEVLGIL